MLVIGAALLSVVFFVYFIGKLIALWLLLLWQFISAPYVVFKIGITSVWPIIKNTFINFQSNLEQK
jgi:hypothetical protein